MRTSFPAARSGGFFGHPRGLAFLSVADAASGFAVYGMLPLLVLYLRSPATATILGFTTFHRWLESLYGPLGADATAAAIAGLFGASISATPLLGGQLADRWLGRTPTVLFGGIAMALGYVAMIFEAGLLLALVAITLGLGCFSANVRVQIGELYAVGDSRRARAFQIYALVSMIAVILTPLIVGTLGEKRGFEWGFAAAAIGAAISLVSYLLAIPHLSEPLRPPTRGERTSLSPHGRRVVLVLILLVPVFSLSLVGNQQLINAYLLWGKDHYDLAFRGEAMPVSWLISFDAAIGTATAFGSILFWRWWATRWREPDETIKAACGALIAALAPLSLAIGSWWAGEAKLGLAWALAFHGFNAIGYANLYPIGLALYSRASPPSISGTMISVFTFSLFGAGLIDSRLGGLLERLSSTAFWSIHAALILVGGLLMLVAGRLSGTTLAPRIASDLDLGGAEAVPT